MTMEMSQATLTERMIFPVTPDMVAEIETYWHDRWLSSKSEVIRQQIAVSLAQWREATTSSFSSSASARQAHDVGAREIGVGPRGGIERRALDGGLAAGRRLLNGFGPPIALQLLFDAL
jgi:hypothetical protein